MLTGNKGEWSEIYTLLKIISDKELYAGDKDLNRIESLIFPIIKVLRTESNGTYEYSYDNSLVVIKNGLLEFKIPLSDFHKQASDLLLSLKQASGSSFSFPETEKFLNTFHCCSLKANSSIKTDIQVVIHDLRTGVTPLLGFSVKSQLGDPSTLLNASKATNFIYRLEKTSLSDEEITDINSISTKSKIKDRISEIKNNKGYLIFEKTENQIFGNNLVLIDSSLSLILGNMLYLFFTSSFSKTKDLVDQITLQNPLGYDLSLNHPFYLYKIKRFLTDIALGMMPSIVWKGELDATGGYLVVKDDGEILCYHIYNRNEFEDYLINNTKFETPSSTKHDFGYVFRENSRLYFKLNLQIRFTK